jgi:hypothetical protein
LQHSDQRPPTSGRPSLLSSEQQAEADRHRILGVLDAKPSVTTAGARKARSGKFAWLLAGAAVLALGAGSMVWLSAEGEKEIVLAGTAPLPSAAAPAVALASEPVLAEPEEEQVSTAAILEDAPVPATKEAPVLAGKNAQDELSKLLDPSPAPTKAPAGESAKPAPAPVRAAAKPPVKKVMVAKPRAERTDMAMNVQPVMSKKVATPAKKTVVQADTDVALLAALVAHSKVKEPKRSTPAAQLQQCKTLGSVAEADQCRARLCAAAAKNESECKATSLAKASSDS